MPLFSKRSPHEDIIKAVDALIANDPKEALRAARKCGYRSSMDAAHDAIDPSRSIDGYAVAVLSQGSFQGGVLPAIPKRSEQAKDARMTEITNAISGVRESLLDLLQEEDKEQDSISLNERMDAGLLKGFSVLVQVLDDPDSRVKDSVLNAMYIVIEKFHDIKTSELDDNVFKPFSAERLNQMYDTVMIHNVELAMRIKEVMENNI